VRDGRDAARRATQRGAAPALVVRGLTVTFAAGRATLTAVDGIDFEIASGEVLGLVGESGAGKSLSGAAILGLVDAPGRVDGEVWLDGQRIDTLDPAAKRRLRGREIGAIFQDPLTALDPLFTIGDQLAETLRTHFRLAPDEARREAVALLQEVGIPGAAARYSQYPHQFSGGMRQRVVIALALAGEPSLLVADEPTTALDVSIQAQIVALLGRLARERGMAILLVTHDMGVIASVADRIAVMYAGRIVETGRAAEVIARPRHPYTKGLMASIPSLADDRARLAQIDGAMPRLGAVPAGCAFHPRCGVALERCTRERPVLVADAAGGAGATACWRLADG
jgi:peptide/nickel transport system ATP-binding protein